MDIPEHDKTRCPMLQPAAAVPSASEPVLVSDDRDTNTSADNNNKNGHEIHVLETRSDASLPISLKNIPIESKSNTGGSSRGRKIFERIFHAPPDNVLSHKLLYSRMSVCESEFKRFRKMSESQWPWMIHPFSHFK